MASILRFAAVPLVSAMVCTAAVIQHTVESEVRYCVWLGDTWQDTIRASPSVYPSSYQREPEVLDTGKQ